MIAGDSKANQIGTRGPRSLQRLTPRSSSTIAFCLLSLTIAFSQAIAVPDSAAVSPRLSERTLAPQLAGPLGSGTNVLEREQPIRQQLHPAHLLRDAQDIARGPEID